MYVFICYVDRLVLYGVNYFANVHIMWFPTIMPSLCIYSRIRCVIIFYLFCQMGFIELVFI